MDGHIARMGEMRGPYRVLVRKPEGKGHLEETGIDGRIILSWFFTKWNTGTRTGFIWPKIRTGVGGW
jgi:hypothetical protein